MWEKYWWVFVVGAVLLFLIVTVIIIAVKNKRTNKTVEKVVTKNGVRYTSDKEIVDENGNVKVSHVQGDIILERGTEYTVSKNGAVIPGKYTMLSAEDVSDTFTVRISDRVREFKHASSVVLAEGDQISPRSNNIILR